METVKKIPEIIEKCGRMHVLGEVLGDEPLRAVAGSSSSEPYFNYTGRYINRLWCFLEFLFGFTKVQNLDAAMVKQFSFCGARLVDMYVAKRRDLKHPAVRDELSRILQAYESKDYDFVLPLLERRLNLEFVHKVDSHPSFHLVRPKHFAEEIMKKDWLQEIGHGYMKSMLSFLFIATMHKSEDTHLVPLNHQRIYFSTEVTGITLVESLLMCWNMNDILELNEVCTFLHKQKCHNNCDGRTCIAIQLQRDEEGWFSYVTSMK
mmetsp:Transcript_26348/g.34627  ORF Transcript_26348/g.34627 Transcript_26348/m.34627 type:complete len:263 (+) Transcript_26348:315-1103(+)